MLQAVFTLSAVTLRGALEKLVQRYNKYTQTESEDAVVAKISPSN